MVAAADDYPDAQSALMTTRIHQRPSGGTAGRSATTPAVTQPELFQQAVGIDHLRPSPLRSGGNKPANISPDCVLLFGAGLHGILHAGRWGELAAFDHSIDQFRHVGATVVRCYRQADRRRGPPKIVRLQVKAGGGRRFHRHRCATESTESANQTIVPTLALRHQRLQLLCGLFQAGLRISGDQTRQSARVVLATKRSSRQPPYRHCKAFHIRQLYAKSPSRHGWRSVGD